MSIPMNATTLPLPRQDAEVEPHFVVWEKSFHAHPCGAMLFGFFPCGHRSQYQARAKCTGCDEEIDAVFLCDHHLRAWKIGLVTMHLTPCGYAGYPISLTEIRPLES